MLRTLIFDWDGTLHDTKALYGRSFRRGYAWLTDQGYASARTCTDEELAAYLGMSAPDMWNAFMPQLPQPVKDQVSGLIGQAMTEEVQAGNAKLYPGAAETLEALRRQGYTLVFLSNCKRDYLRAHRAFFDLDRWFQGYFCCEDYGFAPKAEIFPCIARQFPGDFCVIGDRSSDLDTAEQHGLLSIGCAYGYGTAEELTGADLIAYSPKSLPQLVEQLRQAEA